MTGNTKTQTEQAVDLEGLLNEIYSQAEASLVGGIDSFVAAEGIPQVSADAALALARAKHAFRGAALTLLGIKHLNPDQDIRAHKSEYVGGFSARSYDTKATVPFLISKTLPRSVESHWLTQTLSFAGPLDAGSTLKTQPKNVGALFIRVVNDANNDATGLLARKLLVLIMSSLIEERNRGQVVLTRPKALPIVDVERLLRSHMSVKYKTGAPRLPQIAIYAIYRCMMGKVSRFDGKLLEPLARLKSADRKSGTVGDIVVSEGKRPTEAVEIKFDQRIAMIHVLEAIDKVRAETVSRYYLLSTTGIEEADRTGILLKSIEFEKQNGCEIIVNGVFQTIRYYLRLLPSTTEFIDNYTSILEVDDDVGYEHRNAWNECCATL